jgi:hypothetical protein
VLIALQFESFAKMRWPVTTDDTGEEAGDDEDAEGEVEDDEDKVDAEVEEDDRSVSSVLPLAACLKTPEPPSTPEPLSAPALSFATFSPGLN